MIKLPVRFEEKLKGVTNYANLYKAIDRFNQLLSENNLYFFEEYTDHGYSHINSVLETADKIIDNETFELLSSNDIFLLVSAICLHDLGMHLKFVSFKNLVENDRSIICDSFDSKTWKELWINYTIEAQKFSSRKRYEIFGDSEINIIIPDLTNKDKLTGIDKKLIGEFIRRHHPRIAHEIAVSGIVGDKSNILFFDNEVEDDFKDLSGLLARSHGMDLRDTFKYLKAKFDRIWKQPYDTNYIFLMIVLRMADYFQIDSKRVLKIPFQTKSFKSPFSYSEHVKHMQICNVQQIDDDKETLFIITKPSSSYYYSSIRSLLDDIQCELDTCWAILGEIYGYKEKNKQPRIIYRRIQSNIDDINKFASQISYIPEPIFFKINPDLPKLLISPLYGENPSFGVRELLQNSIDACLTRCRNDNNFKPEIKIDIDHKEDNYFFTIIDNGVGMTLSEIKNYFLTVGNSLRNSTYWLENYIIDNKCTVRKSGRFGIGVLASYLIGHKIIVETKNIRERIGYKFETTLEQNQVDITKNNNLDFGTKITIQISKKIYDILIEDKYKNGWYEEVNIYNFYDEIPYFHEWYWFDYPKVEYRINNNLIDEYYDKIARNFHNELSKKISRDELTKWNIVFSVDFEEIRWRYIGMQEMIICNGIIIPSVYKYDSSIIGYMPTISVIDNDAKLPLGLNRNFFISKIPFIEDVKIDIYKYIIYSLVTFSTDFKSNDNCLIVGSFKEFEHPSIDSDFNNILYSNKGFTLNIIWHRNLSIDNKIINVVLKGGKWGKPTSKAKKNIKDIELSLPENIFIRLLTDVDINRRDRFDKIVEGILIKNEETNDAIRVYNRSNKDCETIIVSEIIYILQKKQIPNQYIKYIFDTLNCVGVIVGESRVLSDIVRVANDYDSQFFKLVDYYLGKDPIIPYNYEERKRKFPKVFEELKRFGNEE